MTNTEESYPHAYESKGDTTISKLRVELADTRFDLAAKIISRSIDIRTGQNIVDLGGATGRLSKAIQNNVPGVNIFNIELSYPDSKTSLTKRNITTAQADITKVPLADNSADRVVTTDVIEHIENGEEVIKEIHRILKPGGKAFIVIADPQEGRFHNVRDHIQRVPSKSSDVEYWTSILEEKGLRIDEKKSKILRSLDWRKIFNLPILSKLKNYPGAASAVIPVLRPGTYIVEKYEK